MESAKNKTYSVKFLEDYEIDAIEDLNPDGMSSALIVDIFVHRGMRFSEATFRKYVQLGLLPRCRRVGSKGKHKGSRGVYPPGTARQINEIKRMMTLDYTIEEIQQRFAFIGGELEELRTLMSRVFDRLEKSLIDDDGSSLAVISLKQQIADSKETSKALLVDIESSAQRIRELRQTTLEAV